MEIAPPAPAEPALAPWQEEAAARERSRQRESQPAPEPAPEPAAKRRNLLFSSSLRKERARTETSDGAPAAEPAPRTFDEAWPETEPRRGDPATRRSRPSSAAPEPAEPPPSEPQVTVLKSGVVDGMAYSLYSDGSIEAQMPEGLMRFASIDELRAHLDQRP